MTSTRNMTRLTVAITMLFTLLGALVTPSAVAQGSASVEIHLRICPTGYSGNNYFEDCHDNPLTDVTVELGGLRDTSGADGNALFYELQGGTYTITDSIPGAYAERTVYCSSDEEGEAEQPSSFTYVRGGIRLDVPSGETIICDWYVTPYNMRGDTPNESGTGYFGGNPPGASVIIHARLCPPGYTGTTPFEDCHDNPRTGVTLTLENLSATTDQSGNTLFYDLRGGTYRIQEQSQGDFWFYSVYCSLLEDISQDVEITYIPRGFEVTVPADTDIICDWYSVPEARSDGGGGDEDEAGRLTIHAAQCPAGYEGQAYFEDCHDSRLADIAFDVSGPEGLLRLGETTDSQGVLVSDGIEVGGTVSVLQVFDEAPPVAVFVVYCSNEQNEQVPFDYVERPERGGIRIDIFRGDDVLCDWYNIPPAA